MSIQINDNSKMKAGIYQVKKRNLKGALALFCSVDSYESALNQIGCLCCLGENFYAVEGYRRLLSRYLPTHNALVDVGRLGEKISALFRITDGQSQAIKVVYDQNKLSADTSLVVNYDEYVENVLSVTDQEEDFAFEDLFESGEQKTYAPSVFFDLNSPEYPRQLYDALVDAYQRQDSKAIERYAKSLLAIESNQVEIVEMQLSLCLNMEKYKQACIFAQKLSSMQDLSVDGVGDSLEALSYKPNDYKDTIAVFLNIAEQFGEQLSILDLQRAITLATNAIGNCAQAVRFAKILFESHYKDIECLRICAYAFFNGKDIDMLKASLVEIRKRLPHDTFVAFTFRLLDEGLPQNKLFKIPDKLALHLQLPQSYVNFARKHFMYANTQQMLLDSDIRYLYLSALIDQSRYFGISGKFADYAKFTSTVRVVLDYFIPTDLPKFYDFCLCQLAKMYPEPSLVGIFDDVIASLVKYGYRGSVLIRSRNDSVQLLDLSQITISDDLFVGAMCVCATLGRVEISALEKAYRQVKERGITLDNSIATLRNLAYYLYKTAMDVNCQSNENQDLRGIEELFVADDTNLYMQMQGC